MESRGGPREGVPQTEQGMVRCQSGARAKRACGSASVSEAAVPRGRPPGGASAAGGPRGSPGPRERVPGVPGALGPAGVRQRGPQWRARHGEAWRAAGVRERGSPGRGRVPGGPLGPWGRPGWWGSARGVPQTEQGMVRLGEPRGSVRGGPPAEGEFLGVLWVPGAGLAGGGPREGSPRRSKAW